MWFWRCLLNWMVGVFYFIKLFKKKKFKTRKCNILVLPVRFMNELYILVYYFMWQVVLDIRDRILCFCRNCCRTKKWSWRHMIGWFLWLVLFSQKIHILLHNLISQAKIPHFFILMSTERCYHRILIDISSRELSRFSNESVHYLYGMTLGHV